ncbi:hypothetical protein Psi02_12490 [Planotetraspora silvatica]|uniref:Uncharacterized protein n=1 Tax=Planotetraspora silvatica TaxID=234614 RepID=A0A8J3XL28_9ACTN|nr:hypothetical protein Psi02_12490 [Planotetraspora silvatica]
MVTSTVPGLGAASVSSARVVRVITRVGRSAKAPVVDAADAAAVDPVDLAGAEGTVDEIAGTPPGSVWDACAPTYAPATAMVAISSFAMFTVPLATIGITLLRGLIGLPFLPPPHSGRTVDRRLTAACRGDRTRR